jgi:hypothetical protein
MQPIQTYYNGLHFRSRLEARWAVFFDAVGIKYRYEAEGYEFSDGSRYLPDFDLPDLGIWVEVKGTGLPDAMPLLETAAVELPGRNTRVHKYHEVKLMLLGDVPSARHEKPTHPVITEYGYWTFCEFSTTGRFDDSGQYKGWGLIPTGIDWTLDSDLLYEVDQPPVGWEGWGSSGADRAILSAAYHKARAARFEFGETPA